jgi:YVTN family beta-propeller protein
MHPNLRFLFIVLLFGPSLHASEAMGKQPVYVGVRACTVCHQGKGMGHACSRWLQTKHARAYAVLARPEARQIAELSGIPQEPQESPLCLGCHATGAHVEEWQREDGFQVADGVQCEKCHGPGSEYMAESVMMDHVQARAAGLMMPRRQDCMVCHEVKGSHVAVHRLPKLDMDEAASRLAHPLPQPWRYSPRPSPPDITDADNRPKLTGSYACGACHKGPQMGYQYSHWRTTAHARAFAVLATDRAYAIAREQGLTTDPQQSPRCLKCHTTTYAAPTHAPLRSYWINEGVGCEACHGAGSDYSPEAVMRDPLAARQAGLKPVSEETCLACHKGSHTRPFDYEAMVQKIAHPLKAVETVVTPQYKTPLNMALHPEGRQLYIACEASDSVVVLDTRTLSKVAEITTGGQPTDVTFHPQGKTAYVSNRLDDTVSVVDVLTRSVTATLVVGDEPHGVMTDRQGRHLYVLNTLSDNISVFDTESLQEVKRLVASRGPWSLSLSPDGERLTVTNNLSRFVPFRTPSLSEITVIDTTRTVVEDRVEVDAANLMQGIAWHPRGTCAFFTLNRTKNLVPMTRLVQGWTITNGLGILWPDGRVDQVLLDEPGQCFPDPADLAVSPDGRLLLVTSSGSNRVAVVDVEKLLGMLKGATERERQKVFPNHLGKPTEFVIAHIPVATSPRGILIAPDGERAYVANALEDTVSVIDMGDLKVIASVDLGGSKTLTRARYGERLFHSADITFHRQFSCHSCHPDGHVDGLTYDIEPDGIGFAPVDNRSLRGILDTAPFKWEGTNPSLQRQCGPRLAVFFTRIDPFTPEELSALDNYICTIERPPNRYRPLGAALTDAQRRGQALFQRTRTNDGRTIPLENRCHTCHCPPLYMDRARHNIGSKGPYDHEVAFDTAHLFNIYDSAPYMHNGIAHTLEEIWTRYNPDDTHGVTNDMTKDQLNDLIEYLKTL